MSEKRQTVSNSYRTKFIILYLSAIELHVNHCQRVSDKLSDSCRTLLIQQYYSVNVKQCQTMSEECQTVTEQSYIYNYIYMFDIFLTLIDILANK